MARKSRKMVVDRQMAVADEDRIPFECESREPAAVYGRLSIEDQEEGAVKEVQIQLVRNYIDSHKDLKYVETYFDDGYTGTNFNRPEFNRLMDDVREKKITCIVVKDLSRFGRNVLEAAYYIEKIFPFLGARLIAVTDNFDSSRKEDMEGLNVPLHILVNAMYSKDISKKVWTSLQQKKQNGYAAGNAAPYGYIRNPKTKRNEIDPETAFYVELIFIWALLGVAINQIRDRLQLLEAPTPHHRLYQLGVIKHEKKWVWNTSTIRKILDNQTYVGDTVSNKTNQALFADQTKIQVSKDEWIVTPDTHPAIIARDDFEAVQVILDGNLERHRKGRNAAKQINERYKDGLQGMVFCADCGAQMIFERLPHGAAEQRKICYYICKGRDLDRHCLGHQLTAQLLQMLVMDQVRNYLAHVCNAEKLAGYLQDGIKSCNPVSEANSKFLQLNARTNEIADKRRRLYEDYIGGVVDIDEYQEIKGMYIQEFDRCKQQLEEARAARQEAEGRVKELQDMARNFRKYLNVCSFDAELVKALVERIEVGSDRRIHLVFKFQDPFAELESQVPV